MGFVSSLSIRTRVYLTVGVMVLFIAMLGVVSFFTLDHLIAVSGADSREMIQDIRFFTLISFLAIVVVSTLLATFMLRGILRYISLLKERMTRIVETGELEEVPLRGHSEIAGLAAAFNALVGQLSWRLRINDGLADLGRELAGDLEYKDVAQKGLNFMARHVSACAGALYGRDGESGECRIVASFALAEGAHFAERFEKGKGVVGQVSADCRPLSLSDLSPDEALVRSGTCNTVPRVILAMPLVHDEEFLGVIELAFTVDPDDTLRGFLEVGCPVFASFLRPALQVGRIRELAEGISKSNEELSAANEELEAQAEELQSQAEELQAQAEELRTQNADLEVQRARAEESERLKTEFLSNVSHELRTPLNSVLALSQLMLSRGPGGDPDEDAEFLKQIELSGHQLLALINDLLDMSRIEAGRLDINPGDVEPGRILNEVVDMVSPLAREKGLDLRTRQGDTPMIYSDGQRIRQILLNLLGNAVKFTDEGYVEATLSSTVDQVRFDVIDTGTGIAEADLDHIFDAFRQADGSMMRRREGTGLGLTISRNLARALGGDIQVSTEQGKGSTFSLVLPMRYPEFADIEKATPADPEGRADASSVSTPPAEPVRRGRRVLVAEDNDVAVLQVRGVLEEAGYDVDVARNGREALELAGERAPDGIVLDLMMPGMDGFQVLDKLRAVPRLGKAPVMVLTAKELTDEERKHLLRQGVITIARKGSLDRFGLLRSVDRMLNG
ncbi:MAG: response regulator [Deltaproteobacteria bacterium]|nr:response regulator [Deltaproteobacteria bacterium]